MSDESDALRAKLLQAVEALKQKIVSAADHGALRQLALRLDRINEKRPADTFQRWRLEGIAPAEIRKCLTIYQNEVKPKRGPTEGARIVEAFNEMRKTLAEKFFGKDQRKVKDETIARELFEQGFSVWALSRRTSGHFVRRKFKNSQTLLRAYYRARKKTEEAAD